MRICNRLRQRPFARGGIERNAAEAAGRLPCTMAYAWAMQPSHRCLHSLVIDRRPATSFETSFSDLRQKLHRSLRRCIAPSPFCCSHTEGLCGEPQSVRARFPRMFLFFSNGFGIAGSIVVSLAVTLLLLYARSGP